jgi:nicotinamide mononucleotide transporter
MALFDVQTEMLRMWGYSMSPLEAIATVLYFVSVALAMRPHVFTWPTGMIANVALFALFYQVQLYSDMLLQCYFLVVSVYGWWQWHRRPEDVPLAIHGLSTQQRLRGIAVLGVCALLLGTSASRLHVWLPAIFERPAAFPYADALVAVSSVVATLLLARKCVENWILWIVVDVVSLVLYSAKGVLFLATEHAIFLGLAIGGLHRWSAALSAASEKRP